ncbi:hypothetical protein [Novosphingobium taihuense]|uniref:Uncharacterized protein n=1 Tax=Novosphingobium taihuense TaxID=260085 RepID=A0A7W7AAZ5_9SPHN|nr:hypothetical protein [Novosphingobium taihuense]MBB4613688.1 hypothetical protein [Novosphingobium taihuense]
MKQSVAARIEVIVRPDGLIEKCTVLETVGPASVARQLCNAQKPRTWKAAVGSDGNLTFGVVREWVKLVVPGSTNQSRISGIEDPVDAIIAMPPGLDGAASREVTVFVEMDEQGTPVACRAAQDAGMADLACAAALKIRESAIAVREAPLPSYVIARTIRFAG